MLMQMCFSAADVQHNRPCFALLCSGLVLGYWHCCPDLPAGDSGLLPFLLRSHPVSQELRPSPSEAQHVSLCCRSACCRNSPIPLRPALASAPPLISALSLPSQKILTMIPTEEEKQKIQEAQLANPDVPLGSAEQFLLTLSSISELSARLQLWAFKMDYEIVEKVRGRQGGRGGDASEALLNFSLTLLLYEHIF